MKKYTFFLLLGLVPLAQFCQSQPEAKILAAADFSKKLNATPDAVVLDVRTPEEFVKGHLPNALNIDWNSASFDADIATLDKSKPVFVYCLSGPRSTAAAQKMRADGFKTVIELQGGMMKWRAARLPETASDPSKTAGMDQAAFDALLKTDKLVLVTSSLIPIVK